MFCTLASLKDCFISKLSGNEWTRWPPFNQKTLTIRADTYLWFIKGVEKSKLNPKENSKTMFQAAAFHTQAVALQ